MSSSVNGDVESGAVPTDQPTRETSVRIDDGSAVNDGSALVVDAGAKPQLKRSETRLGRALSSVALAGKRFYGNGMKSIAVMAQLEYVSIAILVWLLYHVFSLFYMDLKNEAEAVQNEQANRNPEAEYRDAIRRGVQPNTQNQTQEEVNRLLQRIANCAAKTAHQIETSWVVYVLGFAFLLRLVCLLFSYVSLGYLASRRRGAHKIVPIITLLVDLINLTLLCSAINAFAKQYYHSAITLVFTHVAIYFIVIPFKMIATAPLLQSHALRDGADAKAEADAKAKAKGLKQ